MEKIELDMDGIKEFQQNRYPYLLIDYANEIIPGKSAEGYKDLTMDDWWVKVHFPEDPNMPGALQMEAIVQLGALMVTTLPGNKGKIVYLTSANNLKFKKKVMPGDRLILKTKLLSWKRGVGNAFGCALIQGNLACSVEFVIVMPHILSEFKLKGIE